VIENRKWKIAIVRLNISGGTAIEKNLNQISIFDSQLLYKPLTLERISKMSFPEVPGINGVKKVNHNPSPWKEYQRRVRGKGEKDA